MKDKVNKFWWWNRFMTFLYHKTHGIKSSDSSIDHLKECSHCKKGFEKWRAKQKGK